MEKNKQINKSDNYLPLIHVGGTVDLLKCKPIEYMVREHGEEKVKLEIMASLRKCSVGLGINLTDESMEILAIDLLDVYKYDSVEDIIQCLKKGRSGKYGFGMNQRGVLNMLVIREWMSKHLEEKSEIREKELAKFKKQSEELEEIDYKAFTERFHKEAKEGKKKTLEEAHFQAAKAEYFASKNHEPNH